MTPPGNKISDTVLLCPHMFTFSFTRKIIIGESFVQSKDIFVQNAVSRNLYEFMNITTTTISNAKEISAQRIP